MNFFIKFTKKFSLLQTIGTHTRPRAAEIMVAGDVMQLVREREVVQQLFAGEKIFL